jgi:hypothetical protein
MQNWKPMSFDGIEVADKNDGYSDFIDAVCTV